NSENFSKNPICFVFYTKNCKLNRKNIHLHRINELIFGLVLLIYINNGKCAERYCGNQRGEMYVQIDRNMAEFEGADKGAADSAAGHCAGERHSHDYPAHSHEGL
ncbi:MAG TPA: hypothetical protein H9840_05570, partial [Candidatus Anaerofilum excrementigallinarum]|nr:hypothetical protein [Candidatus Anaerofilum excrementigallinarum]